jgi:DNA invertase Pin-like site-specific DNA recombinase
MTTTCLSCGKIPGREYLRVSVDKSGRERSPDEQHADHERAAGQFGFCLCATAYRDIGSASPYARKRRDDFDRLIGDLEEGRFGAALLIIWDSSRGSRRLSEWVRLIELAQEHGVKFFVWTHGRIYDPNNGRDRRSLQEEGVDAEYASSKISDGVLRSGRSNAAAGKWHGRIPYGYRRIRDLQTGKFVAQVPEPEEAEIVRELFARLLEGHSMRSISKDFEARGVLTHQHYDKTGNPLPRKAFSAQHLRSLALSPTYIGERVHDPASRSTGRKKPTTTPATIVKGQWDGIVSKADFLAVQRLLTAPERVTTRPGRGVHLLSMYVLCDVCEGPVSVRLGGGDHTYACREAGHVKINKAALDTYATEIIVGYLARPDIHEAFAATAVNGDELDRVRDEIASIRAELDDLAAQVGSGALSATLAARAEPPMLARLAAAEKHAADLSTPPALAGWTGPVGEVRARWEAAPVSARREVARFLLTPELLGELRIGRAPRRGGPVSDRAVWRRTA